tara:strand:- start:2584 stop:3789 length:1206 start_codon:yes stop_codon:yes gene_type:complete
LNYKQAENWILTRHPFYQIKGKAAYKPGLKNIQKFIDKLNIPIEKLRFIHVGGTNGKGSTCSYISSILQESNFKVGIFSSPHFYDFRERIKVNDNLIEKSYIVKFIKQNKDLINSLDLSFFELSFGLCLSYFYECKTEFCIIEVGLGGRLDSTNIIYPLVSVITNISLDHTEILGDTYEKIAKEKAGIIKDNIKVVIGERNEKTDDIFIKISKNKFSSITFVPDLTTNKIYSDIDYLNKNINTAVEVCRLLNSENINSLTVRSGIENINKNACIFGKWSTINNDPKVIYDSAHNHSGFKYLSKHLKKIKYKRLFVLLGFTKGKNIKELINELPSNADLYFTSFSNERSITQDEIKSYMGENINFSSDPKYLYKNLKNKSSEEDLILITGSNFIAKDLFYEN